jgi:hypothetical protein
VGEWWAEWWTYRPADLLMFSPRIYWRLFESLNDAAWPAPLLVVAVMLAWLGHALTHRQAAQSATGRAALVLAALLWAVVAWAFLWLRYAPIFWPAECFAVVFVLQAIGLAALAVLGGPFVRAAGTQRRIGALLLLWALLGHPLLAAATGRPWRQAEVFGFAPEPTAIGTLGLLLMLRPPAGAARWLWRALWAVPLAWCAVAMLMLVTMGVAAPAWVAAAAALLALGAARRR